MPGLSAWAVRQPIKALIAWFIAVVAIGTLGIGFAGSYNDAFELPDTESKAATDLLMSSGNGHLESRRWRHNRVEAAGWTSAFPKGGRKHRATARRVIWV